MSMVMVFPIHIIVTVVAEEMPRPRIIKRDNEPNPNHEGERWKTNDVLPILTPTTQNHQVIDLENDPRTNLHIIVVPPLRWNGNNEHHRRPTGIRRKRDRGPNRLRRGVVVANLPVIVVATVPTTRTTLTTTTTTHPTTTTTNIPMNSSVPSPKNSFAIPSSIPTATPTNARPSNGGCVFRIPVPLPMDIWI